MSCFATAYVICQSQHSHVRIVPTSGGGVKGNVHSGTVLDDHSIMLLGTKMAGLSIVEEVKRNIPSVSQGKMQLFPQANNSCEDFFLTAQGGLKGTSKPVYYRGEFILGLIIGAFVHFH